MRQRVHPTQAAVSDSLTDYLNGIGRYRVLTRDEEMALGRRIRAGDADAVNQLVCANLRFVVTIAKQYQRHGISLLDLIDEGNLGLIRAAQRFDETKGIKFISYAVWWIRQAILHAIVAQSHMVRVPTRRAADLSRVGRRANALFQKLGREPRQHEIAEALNVEEAEVASAISLLPRIDLSLDAAVTGDATTMLDHLADEDNPSPEDSAFNNSRIIAVSHALSQLRPRDARILRMYFGFDGEEPMTLEEIGSQFGITRERVRQIRDRALRTLRKAIPHLALAG